MRNRRSLALLAACLSLLLVGVSLAIWNGVISHDNILTADSMEGKIVEVFEDGMPPSGTVTKEVSFQNNSSAAVFVRVSCAETWTETKSGGDKSWKVVLSNQVNNKDVAEKNWTEAFKADWVDGKDGWLYYTKVLEPGESTDKILDSVTFPAFTGELAEYQNADYQLYFRMEQLQLSDSQSTLNSDQVNKEASLSVFGREASVIGSVVTWK